MNLNDIYNQVSVFTATYPTDEQKEFIMNIDKDMLCFASPGTGKTSTSAFALIFAEVGYKIKGSNIQAISFTRNATTELSNRYRRMCRRAKLKPTVNFSTLHSLCVKILNKYSMFFETGVIKPGSFSSGDYQSQLKYLETAIEDLDLDTSIEKKSYRYILKAINKLNSSLGFSKSSVVNSIDFVDCNISYENFTNIRHYLYNCYKHLNRCTVSDILLYTLELLERFPEVSEALKKENQIVLIDEAQDLSLLQLRILNLISDKLIMIGDIKQQIYAFNGACIEIVDQYFKVRPEALKLDLTQSFRCKSKVANFANSIIHIGEPFKGVSEGGNVTIKDSVDFNEIAEQVKSGDKNVLITFRNNFSAIPLLETLHKLNVPFRANYPDIEKLPVISDLLALVDLAQFPGNTDFVPALKFLIPEFKVDNPFVQLIKSKKAKSIFDIQYRFSDEYTGTKALEVLYEVGGMVNDFAPLTDIFNKLYRLYDQSWLSKNSYRLEMEPEYYLDIINSVISGKTLSQFRNDEASKRKLIDENEMAGVGVRCYTMHGSKGLESDIVHILDAESALLPSEKNIRKMREKNCTREIIKTIRNERSLCYVAVTRARDEVYIHYKKELSSMFTPVSDYDDYENMPLSSSSEQEDDDLSFKDFYSDTSFEPYLKPTSSQPKSIDWSAI